mgnify:CR=1 FL=1
MMMILLLVERTLARKKMQRPQQRHEDALIVISLPLFGHLLPVQIWEYKCVEAISCDVTDLLVALQPSRTNCLQLERRGLTIKHKYRPNAMVKQLLILQCFNLADSLTLRIRRKVPSKCACFTVLPSSSFMTLINWWIQILMSMARRCDIYSISSWRMSEDHDGHLSF